VRNELGKVAGRESDMDEAERHWRAAQGVFASIGDGENHAVLNINLAQLLRRRSADLQEKAGTLTHAARTHIAEAVSMYQAAFGALKKKQGSPTVWEMVQSELATTFEDFAVMLETDACSQSWNSEGAREDAQLVVDLRNRAMDLLRELRAPAWRLAQAHLSLGSFYLATLHVGGGCVTRTRYDAAEGQLRKCLLVAAAGSAADLAPPSASHLKRSLPQQILGQREDQVKCETALLAASAQLSLLVRVSGGPLKGSQGLRASLESLLCILRLPLQEEVTGAEAENSAAGSSSGAPGTSGKRGEGKALIKAEGKACVALIKAWVSVAEALKGLMKLLASLPPGVSLGGSKEVPKETLKDLYRQALKLNPEQDGAAVKHLLDILKALTKLLP